MEDELGRQGIEQVSPIKNPRTKVSKLPPCDCIEPSEPQVQVFFDGDAVQDKEVGDEPAASDPIFDEANQDDAGEQILPDAEEVSEEGEIKAE